MIAPVESLHLSNFFLRLNWLRVSNFFISFSEFESFHFFDFSKKAQILFFKSVASTNSAISPKGHTPSLYTISPQVIFIDIF